MEILIALLVVTAIVLVLKTLSNAAEAMRLVEELRSRVAALETEVRLLRQDTPSAQAAPRTPEHDASVQERVLGIPSPRPSGPPPIPKLIPPFEANSAMQMAKLPAEPAPGSGAKTTAPKPSTARETPSPAEPPASLVNWEEFM